MEEAYVRLSQRVARLGKHYERFLVTVASNLTQLIERLEYNQLWDEVEFWNLVSKPGDPMKVVHSIGENEQEQLDFMATYFALQFLHMNVRALDRLELQLSDEGGRTQAYRGFLENQASNYQRLNAVYIDNLMQLFLKGREFPEYTLCVVGTRWDQDDVDVMVVDSGDDGRDNLNRALGRIVGEYFKRAGRLHFYIAETMGIPGYSTTVEDYTHMMKRELSNFVMISELLSGEPLVGSWNLFNVFRKEVTDRFYGRRERFKRFYAGFLRGLLGELHSLLVTEVRSDRIDFKVNALRLAKGMTLACKVVYDIHEASPLTVLDRLRESKPRLSDTFKDLQESLVFIETFRLLFHLMGVEEEEVSLDGEHDHIIQQIASVMGFSPQGGVSAGGHLVIRYFESVDRIRETCRTLMRDVGRHVKKASGYSYLKKNGKKSRNVAAELAESVRLFGGHIFFQDVLASLKEKDGKLAAKLVEDTQKMYGKRRAQLLDSYLEFADSDPTTLIELVLIVHKVGTDAASRLFDDLVDRFLEQAEGGDGFVPLVLGVFNFNPDLFNRFIESLRTRQRKKLERLLEQAEIWDDDQKVELEKLKKYIWLRTAGSEYYRRVFRHVTRRNPQFIRHLSDVERLRRYASGFLALPESALDESEALEALGDYYDLSYLACAIEALNGAPMDQYRAAFIEFADTYMSTLYSYCRHWATLKTGTRVETRDLFALFATGGHARGQAFGDDYDLIMVLNSDDPTIFSFAKKVCILLHRALVSRGVIPQYRFSDHFGEFVIRFSQLENWFESGRADSVDKTQVMGARMLVGSSRLLSLLQNNILAKYVFANPKGFCIEMAEELTERRAVYTGAEDTINIKEGIGGLRDIEHLILMLKAAYQVPEPVSHNCFWMLSVIAEEYASEIATLQQCHDLLRRVRDIYRLGVAADDEVHERDLDLVASIMSVRTDTGEGDSRLLAQMLTDAMDRVVQVSNQLVRKLCSD